MAVIGSDQKYSKQNNGQIATEKNPFGFYIITSDEQHVKPAQHVKM